MKVSVVVCTYNRAELLEECLDSLTKQSIPPEQYEVLVVDNNSPDHTAEVSQSFVDRFSNFRLITEKKVGLSHARNTGWQEAKGEWIAYIDDDALATENFVERIYWMLENHSYRMYGGLFLPWYKYGKPHWIQDKYSTNKMKATDVITLPHSHTATGCIMVMEKSLLAAYDGFNPDLGMTGNKVGYSEETDLQYRIRKDGIEVGYDPKLVIHHLVAKYKLEVDWYFRAAFALGRDMVVSGMVGTGFWTLLGHALLGLLVMTKDLIIYTPKLLTKNYYIETWLIDVFRKMAKRIGIVYTGIMLPRTQKPE